MDEAPLWAVCCDCDLVDLFVSSAMCRLMRPSAGGTATTGHAAAAHRRRHGLAAWPPLGDARVELGAPARWKNPFTGERYDGESLALRDVLRVFPIA